MDECGGSRRSGVGFPFDIGDVLEVVGVAGEGEEEVGEAIGVLED